ncbi:MAG TPA: hypothetical protein DF296_13110 [Candidatus Margulisbacteria bacterium]|nr:hypothetical protein [Candidatus Margulisiibacteriota bacterium]
MRLLRNMPGKPIIMNTNEQQLQAITYPDTKPLKILAGAGTGKTFVLTNRFLHLVEQLRYKPQDIVCLTFTVKAADEMKTRIINELLNKKIIRNKSDMALSYISNFHSFCRRLLEENPFIVPIDPSAEIISEPDQIVLMRDICKEFLDLKLPVPEEFRDLFTAMPIKNFGLFVDNMINVINKIKDCLLSPDNYKKYSLKMLENNKGLLANDLYEKANSKEVHASTRKKYSRLIEYVNQDFADERTVMEMIYVIYQRYEEKLREKNKIDFGDLIYYTFELLKRKPDIANKFAYLLIDEFQDTNNAQYELIKLLSRPGFENVTIVGDIKQSIYEWREARPGNVTIFPGEEINLVLNYRSTAPILDLAYTILKEDMPDEKKLIQASNSNENTIVHLFKGTNREAEAFYIARKINQLLTEGSNPGDIVILMRSVNSAHLYSDKIKELGIPCVIMGSSGFFEQNIIKDITAFIRLINNPYNEFSWIRVLASPLYHFTDYDLSQLIQEGKQEKLPIAEIIKQGKFGLLGIEEIKILQNFMAILTEAGERMKRYSLLHVFIWLLEQSHYVRKLAVFNKIDEINAINEFLSVMNDYFSKNISSTIDEFLEYIEIIKKSDQNISIVSQSSMIRIMSVHQSKGLEFPIVFVCNVRPQSFPITASSHPYSFSRDYGVIVKNALNTEEKERKNVKFSEMVKDDESLKRLNEEKRVLYVAITRAKRGLYLTSSEGGRGKSFYDEVAELKETGLKNIMIDQLMEEPLSLYTNQDLNLQSLNEDIIRNYLQHQKLITATAGQKKLLSLSFSQISIYDTCPLKYKYRYIDKIPVFDEFDNYSMHFQGDELGLDAMYLGDILHKLIQLYHYRKRKDLHVDEIFLADKLKKAILHKKKPDSLILKGKEILDNYLRSPLAARNTMEEEKPFTIWFANKEFDVMLKGKIDRIDTLDDHIQIIDYKTNVRIEKDKFRKQLAIYKIALQELYAPEKIIKTSLYFLRSSKEIDLNYSDNELDAVKREILSTASNIYQNKFSKSPKAYCKVCEFSMFCPDSITRHDRVTHNQMQLF